MPPQISRFQSGPTSITPYQHQYSALPQGHSVNHPAQIGGNSNYLNQNAQISPFTSNGNALAGMTGGLNTGGGFGVGAETGLASHAARMGFAHGANLQQQQQQQQQHAQQQQQQQQGHTVMGDHPTRTQAKGRIREVWKHNLEEEMSVLRELVDRYPYIAMDTEFPGVVARPMGSFRGKSDYHYQCLRTNVDLLNIIQIGITLFDEDGNTPSQRPNSLDSLSVDVAGRRNGNQNQLPTAWQFNFKFSLKEDMYNQASIESLQQAGIDFSLLERDGIEPKDFASLLFPSGLIMFEDVKWISFHGGYDFGYLTKLLLCKSLPNDEHEFKKLMKLYFPSTYDVKYLMKQAVKQLGAQTTPPDPAITEILQKFEHKSGLENIAETLRVKRIGSAHQAGSDALITGRVFFAMRERIYNGEIPDEHRGSVWGLSVPDISRIESLYAGAAATAPTATVESTPPLQQQQNGAAQNGTPSTPNTASVGPVAVHTPGPQSHSANGFGMGPMTPGGGGGGSFGNFAYPGQRG